jgi:hypothetical protein
VPDPSSVHHFFNLAQHYKELSELLMLRCQFFVDPSSVDLFFNQVHHLTDQSELLVIREGMFVLTCLAIWRLIRGDDIWKLISGEVTVSDDGVANNQPEVPETIPPTVLGSRLALRDQVRRLQGPRLRPEQGRRPGFAPSIRLQELRTAAGDDRHRSPSKGCHPRRRNCLPRRSRTRSVQQTDVPAG